MTPDFEQAKRHLVNLDDEDVRLADTPLIDTEGNWVEQTRNLIDRKQYKQGGML